MADRRSLSAALREALSSRHNESFERALGRAVHHLGGSYDEYIRIIAEVREYSRVHKMDLRAAAKILADQP
jgi:predicted RNA methylase